MYCYHCEFCRSGNENLCEKPEFTGYTVNGGYAEFLCAPEAFVYSLPTGFSDLDAAPLLCAGITDWLSDRWLEFSDYMSHTHPQPSPVGPALPPPIWAPI